MRVSADGSIGRDRTWQEYLKINEAQTSHVAILFLLPYLSDGDLDSTQLAGEKREAEAWCPMAFQSAEELAAALSYEFYRDGRYAASIGPVEVPQLLAAASASSDEVRRETAGFGGISVQAVGFEQGTDDPAVHIYLTRGGVRMIRGLPDDIDGIPVRAHQMGAINVRPEQAGTSTNFGYLFERGSRICCGSSCAPTSEASTGTLGALVRLKGSRQIYLAIEQSCARRLQSCPQGPTDPSAEQRRRSTADACAG